MVRNRTIVPARYGGTCAVDEADVEEVAPCNPEPCPVECVLGDWDEWASCTASCAGGTKTRERAVVTAAQHGGEECGNTTETIPCNLFACPTPQPTPMPTPQPTPRPTPAPQDCEVSNWSAYSECTQECGGGLMVRNRTIVPARYGGTCAVDETDVEEVAPCNPQPC